MMRNISSRVAFAAALTIAIGGLVGFAPVASASSSNGAINGTTHCDPSSPSCGVPTIGGPTPPFVTLSGNCPAFLAPVTGDPWTLNFVSGNSVSHGTVNKNGDWGGLTAQGQAVLATSDSTVQYAGHLTEWFGGGNNSGGQSDFGLTVDFNGSGIAGNISLHINGQTTTNNSGTLTANFQNAQITCS
jgi:hypothetical protein